MPRVRLGRISGCGSRPPQPGPPTHVHTYLIRRYPGWEPLLVAIGRLLPSPCRAFHRGQPSANVGLLNKCAGDKPMDLSVFKKCAVRDFRHIVAQRCVKSQPVLYVCTYVRTIIPQSGAERRDLHSMYIRTHTLYIN